MKRLLTFVVVLFFIACNNDELYTPLSEATRFHATIEEESTRTFVDEKIRLRWTAEDLISLFEGTTRNKKFMFLGETGDNAGDFEDKTTGFGSGNDVNRYYALYPYASTNKLHEDGYITYTFPTEQTYAENSFGMAANPMVAITEDLNDYDLSFKNVGGYLRLYLFGDDVTIKSIKIEGNDSEPIAGKSIITPVYGGNPAVEMDATATTAVTLNCGEGVAVGSTAETSTPFWIVLPPTTFAEGFTLTITDVNDNEFTKCITSNVNIQRNKYISARIEVDFTVPVPETWKIYYTATGKLNYKSNAFEVNVVSDEWDSTTGEGVITFDGEVTSIGSGAFSASTTLTSITIPDSVTEIGTYTFYDCYNLTNISLPNGLIAIGNNAFRDCSNLQNITIPNGMTTIEYYTFAGCTSLASVTIPNSVTKIDYAAFADCSSLVSITIPDGVAEIASEMFCRCTSLINVVIPESVTAIKESVFAGCSSLVNVTIPDSVTEIRRWAFRDCTSLKSLTITDEVTTIGAHIVWGCTSLSAIYSKYSSVDNRCLIINGVLDGFAPEGLTSYVIPDEVGKIEEYAFKGCTALSSITIPESVTSIGREALNGCSSLAEIYCKAQMPPSYGSRALDEYDVERTIYVPKESVDTYKTASGWSKYADEIEGYNFVY